MTTEECNSQQHIRQKELLPSEGLCSSPNKVGASSITGSLIVSKPSGKPTRSHTAGPCGVSTGTNFKFDGSPGFDENVTAIEPPEVR